MAKVNVTVDTESKLMSVELNGKKLDNITGVSIFETCSCNDDKTFVVRLSTSTKDNDGVYSYTEHMLECCVEAAEAAEYEKSEIEGFVTKPKLSSVQEKIRAWLRK